jgi:uncharacterized repeat protein (TIGR01451 family)
MKRLSMNKIAAALLLVAVCASGSLAAQNDSLKLTTKAEKEVTVTRDGRKETRLTPAQKALPGDVVVFTNHYKNTGSKPADDAAITNPVPEHMVYIDGSAFGEGTAITFSIDKGKTFDAPAKLTKTDKGKKRAARANEYTHIRWTFTTPLPPGKEGDVGFKAQLK